MAAVSIPPTTRLWSIRENHITDTLPLTESVWEQGGKTNGPIQYNVGLEWSWQKLQICSNQIVQQSWCGKIWPICKNQKLGEWCLCESDVRWIQWLGRECEHAKCQQLIRLKKTSYFRENSCILWCECESDAYLRDSDAEMTGTNGPTYPGIIPYHTDPPSPSCPPRLLGEPISSPLTEITVSSTITIIHTWHLT